MSLLEIRQLRVQFGATEAVQGIDLDVESGELFGIVGESGSGKSVSMLALMGLIDAPGRVQADVLRFDGKDLLTMTAPDRRRLLGRDLAMIFQDPNASLNPSFTVGDQITETLKAHQPSSTRATRREQAVSLLRQVEIADPERRLAAYPHQLSGGMSQRVMIAMALACSPRLLIADEPTTALDVTIQAQVLELLVRLQRERRMAVVFITHDLALLAEHAQRIAVMKGGQVVETGDAAALLAAPQHRYTQSLLAALPERQPRRVLVGGSGRVSGNSAGNAAGHATGHATVHSEGLATVHTPCRLATEVDARPLPASPLLVASNLQRIYKLRRGWFQPPATVRALDGVSFHVHPGETLAVVGESGCGKSTLARVLTMVEMPSGGELSLAGIDIVKLTVEQKHALRPQVQMVFQNPYASLNPRKRVAQILDEPLRLNTPLSAAERRQRVANALQQVGLPPEHGERWPHMFSGGQRQRIAIARAMMLAPRLLVADEPTSALDVSIQAQILQLLARLQRETGSACVFISHNLAVVELVADRVLVMYLGRIAEMAPAAGLFSWPRHPYTRALLSATPSLDPARRLFKLRLAGEPPSPLHPPSGCAFHPRCPAASARCANERPELRTLDGHEVACHHPAP